MSTSKYILVVDDDPIMLDLLVRCMAQIGFRRVAALDSSAQALEMLKRCGTEIGLVMLDLSLPAPNGVAVAHIIRDEMRLTMPMIALTTQPVTGSQDDLEQAGFDVVLHKPFDVECLEWQVMNHFRG